MQIPGSWKNALCHGVANSKGISISDLILIEKAKEFGEMLGIVEGSSFNYSFGWLERFNI